MTKDDFLSELYLRIGRLPPEEIKRSRDFYSEAIDDRIEDGQTEEEAVAALGSLDDIVRQIEENVPLYAVMRTRVRDAKKRAGEKSGRWAVWIIIAAVTFPIWFGLLMALLGVAVAVWAVIFSLFGALISIVISGVVLAVTAFLLPYPALAPRLMLAGLGLILASVGVMLLPVFSGISRALWGGLRAAYRCVKRSILGKRGAEA